MPPTLNLDDKDKVYKVCENEDVTFNVKVSGVPTPDVEWSQSKKIITKTPRTTPTFDEQSAQLTIRKVQSDDEGEYTIRLSNPSGEAEANLKLVIMREYTNKIIGTVFFNHFNLRQVNHPLLEHQNRWR